jgi:predicted nucleotide-binding protein
VSTTGEWTYRYVELTPEQSSYARNLVERGNAMLGEGKGSPPEWGAWMTEFLTLVQSIDPLGNNYSGSLSSAAHDAQWLNGNSPKSAEEQATVFGRCLGVARSLLTGPVKIVASKLPSSSGISTLSDGDPDNSEGEGDLTSQLEEASPAKSVGAVGPGDRRSVFLVHGRDNQAAIEMRSFLRALSLRIIEWETAVLYTRHAAPYIGDVIFAGMRMADAVVILSTPDDLVRLRPDLLSNDDSVHEREIRGQARANVIYEAGIADALDRSRTVLVELGGVKSLSDLGGRNILRFDGSSKSRHKLVVRLSSAGLEPDTTGDDWLETGDFGAAIEAARMGLATAT